MSHNWHTFNSHHILDTDNARGWNHAEQPYPNIARGAPESSSNVHPVNSNTVQGRHVLAQWTPPPMSSGYPPPSVPNLEFPHYQYQPMVPCPSHDPFLQQSAAGDLHLLQLHQRSSLSSISGQFFSGPHDVQASVSGRGTYKRKSSELYDMGSTSRYHEVARSSESQLPAVDSWQEKAGAESYRGNWNYPQCHGVNNFSVEGDHVRNVRSRTAPDIDQNPARTHLVNNSLYHPLSNEQSNPVDHWAQGSGSSTVECAYRSVPPSDNAIAAYGSDSRYNSHEPSPMNMMSNHRLEIGSCSNIHSMRNPAPSIINSHTNHHVGGVRIGNRQRSFRASSSGICPRHVQTSGERVISGPSLPLSDPRPHTTLRFRNSERNGRIMTDRYRSLAEANFRDQHREMRLDVDNMSYEELLALGERIGSVSTGLSDTLISKCLIESIYCSSDASEDEGNCVICLDEYVNMDDVGTLKACRHDFHVACIRKWLSMKNLCPICKATALDNSK